MVQISNEATLTLLVVIGTIIMVTILMLWNVEKMNSRKRPWDVCGTRGIMFLITGTALFTLWIFDWLYDGFPNPSEGWVYKGVAFENWIGAILSVPSIAAAVYYFVRGAIEEHQIRQIIKACRRR